MEKIAAVTGATRGLGWGTAQALAKQGYHVLLLGRHPEKLEERRRALAAEGHKADAFAVDLADEASIERCASEVRKRFPELHLLVNNAGVVLDREGYDPAKVRATLQTNTLGPLQLAYALAPALQAGRANVVNVSSGMGSLTEMEGGSVGYRDGKRVDW